jgi:hypothetical protein
LLALVVRCASKRRLRGDARFQGEHDSERR